MEQPSLLETFEQDGFVVIEDAIGAELAAECREAASAAFDACLLSIEARGLALGIGHTEGFDDVVQRSPSRYEMQAGLAERAAFARAARALREARFSARRGVRFGVARPVSHCARSL